MSHTHIPRRSGVGTRQVLPPAKPQAKFRRRTRGPKRCGVAHPDHGLTCTAEVRYVDGKRVNHRGDHRARPLVGIVFRWAV